MADPIMSVDTWTDNGHLIADAGKLGYIYGEVLDPTYGYGTFWNQFKPDGLVACDLDPEKNPLGDHPVDFTDLPWPDNSFDTVVFDPPYKLNGTPTADVDERYGVHVYTRWQDKMKLIRRGVLECARVTRDMLLVKCQDQVCSGQMVWQTDVVTNLLCRSLNRSFRKVDRFDFVSYRAQPATRSQKHARHNASQLLVFSKKG